MEKEIIIQKEKSLVNSVYKLTLDEQRLFHYAIAKVNPFKHRYGQYYLIEVKKLIEFYGLDSKSAYSEFYAAIEKLFNRQCTYSSQTLKKQVTCRLIVDKITDMTGVIGLRFSDQVAEMITTDKDFLAYKLAQTVNITSPNANRIYEILLYSLQRSPINKLNKKFDIAELKNLMGLSDKYQRFFQFKGRVLEVAKAQINKHTDLRINYEIIKNGRTPSYIKFNAQYKKGQEPNSIEDQREMDFPNQEKTDKAKPVEPTDAQRAKRKADLKTLFP